MNFNAFFAEIKLAINWNQFEELVCVYLIEKQTTRKNNKHNIVMACSEHKMRRIWKFRSPYMTQFDQIICMRCTKLAANTNIKENFEFFMKWQEKQGKHFYFVILHAYLRFIRYANDRKLVKLPPFQFFYFLVALTHPMRCSPSWPYFNICVSTSEVSSTPAEQQKISEFSTKFS